MVYVSYRINYENVTTHNDFLYFYIKIIKTLDLFANMLEGPLTPEYQIGLTMPKIC